MSEFVFKNDSKNTVKSFLLNHKHLLHNLVVNEQYFLIHNKLLCVLLQYKNN